MAELYTGIIEDGTVPPAIDLNWYEVGREFATKYLRIRSKLLLLLRTKSKGAIGQAAYDELVQLNRIPPDVTARFMNEEYTALLAGLLD